jgi:hypothetical protein
VQPGRGCGALVGEADQGGPPVGRIPTPGDVPAGFQGVQQPGFASDAALADFARTRDVATARWVAKTLQYPTTDPQLSGPAWPWASGCRAADGAPT